MKRVVVLAVGLGCGCSGPSGSGKAETKDAKAVPSPESKATVDAKADAAPPTPAVEVSAEPTEPPPTDVAPPPGPNPLDDCEYVQDGVNVAWSCNMMHLAVRADDGKAADATKAIPNVIEEMYQGDVTSIDERTAMFNGFMRDIPSLFTAEIVQLDAGPRVAITECSTTVRETVTAEHPRVKRCLEIMPFARAAFGKKPPGTPKPPKDSRPIDFVPETLSECALEMVLDDKSWDCGALRVDLHPEGLYDADELETTIVTELPGKYDGETRWLDGEDTLLFTGVEVGDPEGYVINMIQADPSTTKRQATCFALVDELADADHAMVTLCLKLMAEAG